MVKTPSETGTKKDETHKRPKPMPVPNPWNVPAPPNTGDADINVTYASVGRALSNWEQFESHLAVVFARLIGIGSITRPAERAYGSVRTFEGRVEMITYAAESHFDLFGGPNSMKAVQSVLKGLLKTARQDACPRRNEIAHGVVQEYGKFVHVADASGFVLGPSDYMTNKRNLADIEVQTVRFSNVPQSFMKDAPTAKTVIKTTLPSYLYSSKEIDKLGELFLGLVQPARTISHALLERISSRP
jgi:hypothetical protein